ncbi:hypothetical protein FOQG_17421 [Fusarium oxysporum f. sp. raphani 54005]|uniref:Uncharacterized protein n=3 Tax=Fusarium oxysporum TaxID=5507 RepID=X0B7Z2_FUSOX|nr:hypothetical protein FOVG_14608 [Fusarium oxysporum f. sp. pisi HDV247]EXK77891.1 hypothetical protein FOQG_17421 [Fusarium oxysporum f. sp. raphani 54005]EXM15137.1 hypothetical protein FOTG_16474 [Fusarium oxysporum f. sp. vasinfectum 25433]
MKSREESMSLLCWEVGQGIEEGEIMKKMNVNLVADDWGS